MIIIIIIVIQNQMFVVGLLLLSRLHLTGRRIEAYGLIEGMSGVCWYLENLIEFSSARPNLEINNWVY